MQIFHNLAEWRQVRKNLPQSLSLGFVPTMGNLHPGHVSLFTVSQQENNYTAVSIFVNPTQFNHQPDFNSYPRTLVADLALLQQTQIDYCLLPDQDAIYHDDYHYHIEETNKSLHLEGKQRPGHFTGVLTIVMKLLNLVKPHRSYFGEKDYQQYQLIRDMVSAFFMDIEIKVCPTMRESSGLAYSSRNQRLNPEQRLLAEQFAQIICQRKACEQIIVELEKLGIMVEYVTDHEYRRYAAVSIDGIRLIDNLIMS